MTIHSVQFGIDGDRLSIVTDVRTFQLMGMAFTLAAVFTGGDPELAATTLHRATRSVEILDDDIKLEHIREDMESLAKVAGTAAEGISDALVELYTQSKAVAGLDAIDQFLEIEAEL